MQARKLLITVMITIVGLVLTIAGTLAFVSALFMASEADALMMASNNASNVDAALYGLLATCVLLIGGVAALGGATMVVHAWRWYADRSPEEAIYQEPEAWYYLDEDGIMVLTLPSGERVIQEPMDLDDLKF